MSISPPDEQWFMEEDTFWKGVCVVFSLPTGQKLGLKIVKELVRERTKYQDLLIFDSESYGRCLALDGALQVTERDEYSYQEMITHIPLFAHECPQSVLIIGAGDGGALREVVKHSCVRDVTQCEIDESVVHRCQEFMPNHVQGAFDDPRVHLVIGDACKFIEGRKAEYDVVIIDSSDPVGPASVLFTPSFFREVYESLKPGGIMCNQGECYWLHLDLIHDCLKANAALYPTVGYASVSVPTYPCGQIGFVVCQKEENSSVTQPNRPIPSSMKLRFYNSQVHKAAFVLPQFVQEKLSDVLPQSADSWSLAYKKVLRPLLGPSLVAFAAATAVILGVKGVIKR